MKIRKKVILFEVINKRIIYRFFRVFTNNRKPLPNIFKYRSTDGTFFQQFGKKDSFRHILKSSASMHESSDSHFFGIITGIKSGLDAFDKSWLVMTFLTNLGVTGILRIFRLVLEGRSA